MKQPFKLNNQKEVPTIIDQLKNGNISILEDIYRKYAKHLFNYGVKFAADSELVEDCIQELFLTIWTRREYLGSPANFKNYLFKAFRISLFKKIKLLEGRVNYEDIEAYRFEVTLSIEDNIIEAEQNTVVENKIQASLSELTPRQREAIFLKFYEGLSYDEIAQVMGITVKGSYKLVARSIEALKDHLSPDNFLLLLFLLSFKIDL